MDERAHEVGVHAGEPQPAWCDTCQRHSASTVNVVVVSEEGVSVIGGGVRLSRVPQWLLRR